MAGHICGSGTGSGGGDSSGNVPPGWLQHGMSTSLHVVHAHSDSGSVGRQGETAVGLWPNTRWGLPGWSSQCGKLCTTMWHKAALFVSMAHHRLSIFRQFSCQLTHPSLPIASGHCACIVSLLCTQPVDQVSHMAAILLVLLLMAASPALGGSIEARCSACRAVGVSLGTRGALGGPARRCGTAAARGGAPLIQRAPDADGCPPMPLC